MDLSIIVPVYKVEKFISFCIESIIKQRESSIQYELIIVNDGTPDRSMEIAKEMLQSMHNVIYVDQQNRGLSAARNAGLSKASGKYVWFIDSDDWIDLDSFSILSSVFQLDVDAISIVGADVKADRIHRRYDRGSLDGKIVSGYYLLSHNIYSFCVPFTLYNRSFLLNNGLYQMEGIYHEDNEFTPRAYYKALSIYILNDVLYYVRSNPESITRAPNLKRSFDLLIVSKSLDEFMNSSVLKAHRTPFHTIISLSLNKALFNIYQADRNVQNEFLNKFLELNLLSHYFLSPFFRYKLQGVFFLLNPKGLMSIYKCLNFLYRKLLNH